MSAASVKRLKRGGSGSLGLARHSDCPSHMPVPSIVLVLFMVHLTELLTHGILPHANAATSHASLSCQAMPDLARPKQAHLCKWQSLWLHSMVGILNLFVFFITMLSKTKLCAL